MILAIQCLNRNRGIQEILISVNRADVLLNSTEELKLVQQIINEEINSRLKALERFKRNKDSNTNRGTLPHDAEKER